MSFAGGCLCGGRRYLIHRRFLNAMHCWCSMCRRAHGTAFSTHLVLRPDQLEWTFEQSALAAFESSPGAYRRFCVNCGTHLIVHGQTGDDSWAVPAGTLDGDPHVNILGHMYVSECVPWQAIADDLPRHETWPPGFGRSEARDAGPRDGETP